MARFVAAGAIDLKTLYMCNFQTKFQSDLILGHQGAKTENTKSGITPERIIGSSSNFYQRYI
jgi:hypothetical protein